VKVVHKCPIHVDLTALGMRKGADVCYFGMQDGEPMIWALVDTEEIETETRLFRFVGTGQEIRDSIKEYVGSVIDGRFVWHLYEVE